MSIRLTFAVSAIALLAGAAVAQTPASPAAATQTAPATPAPAASGDIIATAQAAGQFSTLLKAAEETGLTPVLKGAGPLTVFAPTDAAFAALPAGELERLMADKAELQRLLALHVVNTRVTGAQLKGKKGKVPTVANVELTADGVGHTVRLNNATVVRADIPATNGVIHVIDKVLSPTATPTPSATAEAGAAPDTGGAAGRSGATPATPAAKPATPAAPGR